MARLLTCGWETANACEATTQNNFTYLLTDTTVTRNTDSVYSMKIQSTLPGANGFQYPLSGAVLADTWYARFFLYLPGTPTAAHKFFGMNASTTVAWPNTGIELRLNTDRTVSLIYNNTAQTPTSAALATTTWHMIEVRGISGTSGQAELVVNGTSVVSVSGTTGQAGAFAQLQFGSDSTAARGIDLYIDDLALNDSNGAASNTWVGNTNLKMLLATADSAVGTGWLTSGNNIINLYTNIDNVPPLGIADVINNEGHQIRNGSNVANSAYDATLQSYSAAGVAAIDVINVVQALVVSGAPVSTSAKSGTVGCVSNPSSSMANLAAGPSTAGQFWTGVAAGTYPTGWKTSLGPAVHGDIASGSRSTAPVVRINQVTANTRIAMVTLLGMYVDYTPGTPAAALVWKPSRGPNYRR